MDIYLKFEKNEYSKIFDNEEFGYWKITVERPLKIKVEINNEKLENFKQVAEEAKDKTAYSLVYELYNESGKDIFYDYNEFEELLMDIAKGEKLPSKRIKLIREFFGTRDEEAERIVKKVLKREKEDAIQGKFKLDNRVVEFEVDTDLRDTEQIPLNYDGGIEKFFENEVLPYAPDAWIDKSKTQIGYEISFTKIGRASCRERV